MDKNLERYIRQQGLSVSNHIPAGVSQAGGYGVISTPNTIDGINWEAVRNQEAVMATTAALDSPSFFGQSMTSTYSRKINMLWALGFRLQMAGIYRGLSERVYAAAPIGEEVHIFMQTKQGKSLVVTDGKANFPSDELITKLRMLEG